MTAALTPALALAYLGELTVDVRAAVVLGPGGEPLAGDAALAPRALALLEAPGESAPPVAGGTPAAAVRTTREGDGTLLVACGDGGGAIAVLAGPCALVSLLGHDLADVAGRLELRPPASR